MCKIPYLKEAITYEEQLDKLMDRGLAVSNRAYALKNLQHISYYRLSAYWFPFRIRRDSGKATDKFFIVPMLLRGNACGKQNLGASPVRGTMRGWMGYWRSAGNGESGMHSHARAWERGG